MVGGRRLARPGRACQSAAFLGRRKRLGGARPSPAAREFALYAITPLADADPAQVEALLDAAFGADRHLRTAYRLRDGVRPVPALSFAAQAAEGLAGVAQCWPVELAHVGPPMPLVLVGPVAVAPALQRGGLGKQLMARLLAAWDGRDALVLIGDPEYYARFGFTAAATGGWELPGPVERRRLLARAGIAPLPRHGRLGARG